MAVIVPFLEWRPDPVSSRSVWLLWFIFHTIVGTVNGSLSGRHYHIYIRADGSGVQIQDLLLRSAASVEANPYSIAVTAEDKGPAFPFWSGNDVPDYTKAQKDTLVRLLVWMCIRFGIPPDAVRDTCLATGPGMSWHRLGIDGNWPRWPSIFRGRENKACLGTSLSFGKGCPGDRRIRSINTEIIPRAIAILRGLPPTDWLDMATEAQVRQIIAEELRAFAGKRWATTDTVPAALTLSEFLGKANHVGYPKVLAELAAVREAISQLAVALEATPEAVWETVTSPNYGTALTTLRDTRTIARRTEQAVEALGGDTPPP